MKKSYTLGRLSFTGSTLKWIAILTMLLDLSRPPKVRPKKSNFWGFFLWQNIVLRLN